MYLWGGEEKHQVRKKGEGFKGVTWWSEEGECGIRRNERWDGEGIYYWGMRKKWKDDKWGCLKYNIVKFCLLSDFFPSFKTYCIYLPPPLQFYPFPSSSSLQISSFLPLFFYYFLNAFSSNSSSTSISSFFPFKSNPSLSNFWSITSPYILLFFLLFKCIFPSSWSSL